MYVRGQSTWTYNAVRSHLGHHPVGQSEHRQRTYEISERRNRAATRAIRCNKFLVFAKANPYNRYGYSIERQGYEGRGQVPGPKDYYFRTTACTPTYEGCGIGLSGMGDGLGDHAHSHCG